MDMQSVYKKLTSVDIEEQKRIWDERGKGYYGEYLLLTKLYQYVQGQCKILMNLNVPVGNGKTTEIDLLMIHETGLYVFEVKYYKGTIYGNYNDEKWTQYFRTQANSHFHSPIKQNEYHIAALKKLYPGLPVYSFIVFTNDETEVKVTGWEDTGIVVCQIDEIWQYIEHINSKTETGLSGDKIDELFTMLSAYAPITETVEKDGQTLPLSGYIEQLKTDFATNLEENKAVEKKKYKRKISGILGTALVFCGITAIISGAFMSKANQKVSDASKAQQAAEQNLADFEKKFKRVEPMNGGNVELEDGFLTVKDILLEKSVDLKDTFLFSCKLQVNSEKYSLRLTKDTAIIVKMKDGSIAEYTFGTIARLYSEHWVSSGRAQELPEIQIFTDSADSIECIKLTGAMVCGEYDLFSNYIPGIEFELYSAE